MALAVGTRIGAYEIIAPLGAGGMGEVYRARDTKLNRDVALKILPQAFAIDLDRLARFKREAQILASLNHPNIAVVYGLEEGNGVDALVMELVEGPTLADRIERGPIPVGDALSIAKQIADGLEAAHEQGVIHRDLKPANIKLRPDGTVKVLDFGLAKAVEPASGPAMSPTMSPTIATPAMTQMGVILGTAAYMSPEQAKGRVADKRSDIWAFGCVLYEMLTGTRAFEGDDVSETLAAILRDEPDWQRIPAQARRVIRWCLQKDPKRRLRDIGDARTELEESAVARVEPREMRPRRLYVGTLAVVVAFATGALATWVRLWSSRVPAPAIERLSMVMPGDHSVRGGPSVAISHDGRKVAYVAERDGSARLFVRDLADADARVLVETGQPWMPFFSPDGETIGFFAGGKLKTVAVSGGTPVVLCDAPDARGGTWGLNDLIVFAPTAASRLFQIPASGGIPKPLTTLEVGRGEASHRWPQLLPRNGAVLFAAGPAGTESNFSEGSIKVQSLETGEHHVVLPHGTYPRYVPSGHLMYVENDIVFARRFDLTTLTAVGPSVSVLPNVYAGAAGQKPFDISDGGNVVLVPGSPELPQPLFILDSVDATIRQLPFAAARFRQFKISPDGRRLAVGVVDAADTDVWVYQLENGTRTRITSGGANRVAAWSNDGQHIVYAGVRGASAAIYRRAADASAPEEALVRVRQLPRTATLTPDNHTLIVDDNEGGLVLLDLADVSHPHGWADVPADATGLTVSPDGEWAAFASNQSGRPEVYVRSISGKGGPVQVSTRSGFEPVWARHGGTLFFRDFQRDVLMAVTVTTKPMLSVSQPRRVAASASAAESLTIDTYDVMPDDRRFVIKATPPSPTGQRELSIITNWFQELNARVPLK